MRFERYLHLSSCLLILTGFVSILITGSYVTSTVFGIAVTLAYGFSGERLSRWIPVPRPIWNVIAIGLLAYLAYESFFTEEKDLVGNGVKFVVFLQMVKLLSPKENRDHLQIYLLSFLHVLASTVISSDVSFAGPFLVYIVLATWTLSLFNLKRQVEDAAAPGKRTFALRELFRSREIITRRYLIFTSLLSISIIVITLLVFFMFPRISMGNFLKRVNVRQDVSGFSSEVKLGTIGTIKLNNSIALRVEVDRAQLGNLDLEHLYWRGTASDFFDGKKWSQTFEHRAPVKTDIDEGVVTVDGPARLGGVPLSYRVFLEAMNPPILFAADSMYRITWDKTLLERIFRSSFYVGKDLYDSFYLVGSNYVSDLSYQAESRLYEPEARLLRNSTGPYPFEIRRYYLQLPDLDPEVNRLIQGISLAKKSRFEDAESLVSFLEKRYQYTLEVQDAGVADPLRFFFLDRKEGHCEYFSTALAILLRAHGIPARHVVGFRGGELNNYGNYIAVRQSDAHTWVEAYFNDAGWVRMDPSPSDSGFRTRREYFKFLSQFVDYLRLRWNKYVIEYDLRSQARILEKIGRQVASLSQSSRETERDEKDLKETALSTRRNAKRVLWVILGGVVCLIAVYGLWKRRRRSTSAGRMHEVVQLFARRGFQKPSTATFKEWQRDIEVKLGKFETLDELIDEYYAERFGKRKISSVRWAALTGRLKARLRKAA